MPSLWTITHQNLGNVMLISWSKATHVVSWYCLCNRLDSTVLNCSATLVPFAHILSLILLNTHFFLLSYHQRWTQAFISSNDYQNLYPILNKRELMIQGVAIYRGCPQVHICFWQMTALILFLRAIHTLNPTVAIISP